MWVVVTELTEPNIWLFQIQRPWKSHYLSIFEYYFSLCEKNIFSFFQRVQLTLIGKSWKTPKKLFHPFKYLELFSVVLALFIGCFSLSSERLFHLLITESIFLMSWIQCHLQKMYTTWIRHWIWWNVMLMIAQVQLNSAKF